MPDRIKKRGGIAREGIVVFLFSFLLVFGILVGTGTLTSGWHFVDDHELYWLKADFASGLSVLSVVKKCVLRDLNVRFRPLFYVERVIGVWLFGTNLLSWNIIRAIEGALTVFFLYWTARYLKSSKTFSALFSLIVVIGPQFAPWYRFTNQENIGMLFCSLALYLIARQSYYQKYRDVWGNIWIIVCCILCSLMKESFTLFLPVFILLKIGLEYLDRCGEERALREVIRHQILFAGVISAVFVFNISVIVFFVGTDRTGYAGFSASYALQEYVQGIIGSLKGDLRWHVVFGAMMFVAAFPYGLYQVVNLRKDKRKDTLFTWLMVCIGVYVMASQMVLHAKGLMWERYMLPWSIGYGLIFVVLAGALLAGEEPMKKYTQYLYVFLLAMLLCVEFRACLYGSPGSRGALDYAKNGREINRMLQDILDNTDEDTNILVATDGEVNLSACIWLEIHGRKNGYEYVEGSERYYDIYDKTTNLAGKTDKFIEKGDVDVVVMYSREGEKSYQAGAYLENIIQALGTEESDYDVSLYDGWGYRVLYKK